MANSSRNLMCYFLLCVLISLQHEVIGQRATVTSDALWAVVDDFWTWRLRTWPEYGTKYGFYEHDDKVEEFSETAFEQQHNYAVGLLERCRAVPVSSLSTQQDRATLAVLQANLHGFIEGFEFRKYSMYNPGVREPVNSWAVLLQWKPLRTEKDYRMWLSRLRQFPTQLQQKQTLMQRALASGKTLHTATVDFMLGALDVDIKQSSAMTFSLTKPFTNISASIDEQVRQELYDSASQLLTSIRQSLESFAQFLRNEYRPRCRSLPGVHALPSGDRYYEACLRWHTSLNLTARQVHDIGLREVDNILTKMADIAGVQGDIRDHYNVIRNQSENYFNSMGEISDFVHEIHANTSKNMHRLVRKVPKMPLGIEIIMGQGGGFYNDPSLDGSRSGVVNLYFTSPRSSFKFSLLPLMLHEGNPGHHLQAAYAAESNMPYFRRAIEFRKYWSVPFNWPFHTAYIEGWGLYAESLGEELGIFEHVPNARLGRYMTDLYRAARLVVDTGIHALNWTVEQSVTYLTTTTTMNEASIRNEMVRYISSPGQACSYKIGDLEFQRLRHEAQSKLGSSFDLRDFHEAILELGPAPLSVLQQHVRDWIATSGGVASACPSLTSLISSLVVMLTIKNLL